MRHLQAVVVPIACALALLSASALARDVRFPAENASPDVTVVGWSMGVALKAVQADTLVLGSAEDVVLALGALIAGARLEVVASAGPAMMYQYPEALPALIDSFIRQTDRSRSPSRVTALM